MRTVLLLVTLLAWSASQTVQPASAAEPLSPPRSTPGTIEAGHWAQFGYNHQHSGFNRRETVLTPRNVDKLTHAWSSSADFYLSAPSVSRGVIYVGSDGDSSPGVYAIDASTGARRWYHGTGGIVPQPAVVGGLVYATMYHGLIALNAGSGAEAWRWTTGRDTSAAPTVAGNAVYITDGDLEALDASKGTLAWTGSVPGGTASSPAVAGGLIYVTSLSGDLYAFSVGGCGHSDCSPVWMGNGGGSQVVSSAAVAGGAVYVTGSSLFAFPADGCGQFSCSPTWTGDTGTVSNISPAAAYGFVYVVDREGTLRAFEAAGCVVEACLPVWTAAVGQEAGPTNPAVANHLVYVFAWSKSSVLAFRAGGCNGPPCTPLAKLTNGDFNMPQAKSLAVAGGSVYAIGDASVVAFRLPPAPRSLHQA
jgi:hypothetical protein